ncbi:MAG: hypothetical protein ACRDYA_18175 [Egibacteraceae bacterium]
MPHVLRYVVDDDAAIRVALERAPRLEGFAVSTGNGRKAALADAYRDAHLAGRGSGALRFVVPETSHHALSSSTGLCRNMSSEPATVRD